MKRNSMMGAALFLVGMFFGAVPSARGDEGDCNLKLKSEVIQFGGSGATGRASLCVSDDGVRVSMRLHNLVPGRAYTAWFVYFDRPSECANSGVPSPNEPCGSIDLVRPVPDSAHPSATPPGVFGRMDSAVADDDGEVRFFARLQHFHVSRGAHVHVGAFVHDPASSDNKVRARQLLTPEAPGLGAPGLGVGPQKGFLAAAAVFYIPMEIETD